MPPPEDIYPETNVATALFDGYGVRALLPSVRSVTFARDSIPVTDVTRYVVYAATGELAVFSPEQLDSLLASEWVLRW
jgi:hypothetical protein